MSDLNTFPRRYTASELAKPAKGTAHLARRKDQADARAEEIAEKAKARKRDGRRNRWPGTPNKGERLEAAHWRGKGAGGENLARNLILLDWLSHQGPRSLHSGHLRIKPLTEKLCNGICEFYERDSVGSGFGPWRLVGRETAINVLEKIR